MKVGRNGFGRFALRVGLFVGLLGGAARAAGETLADVERQMIDKWNSVRTLVAEMRVDSESSGGQLAMKSSVSGTIEFARDGGREFVRQELTTHNELQEGKERRALDGTVLKVGDGQFMWVLSDQGGKRVVMKSTVDNNPMPLGGKSALDTLRKDFHLSLGEPSAVGGEECWVLLARPKLPSPTAPAEVQQFVRKSDGLLLRSVGRNTRGDVMMTAEYTNLRVNTPIPPERFRFTPPPGVQVIDHTTAAAPGRP